MHKIEYIGKKPSITTLTGLLDKPALLNWANKIGLEGVKLNDYRKAAATDGTNLHSEIKDYIFEGKSFTNPEYEANFVKFLEENNVEDVYNVEMPIETDWFIGRYDIYLKANGINYMCDFKSNTNIYLEQVLQLTGYKMSEPACQGIGVIEIPSFKFKPLNLTSSNFYMYENILEALYLVHQSRKQLEFLGFIH